MRLVASVFGTVSENARAVETAKLLAYGFNFFETKVFHEQDSVMTEAPLWKGAARMVKSGVSTDLAVSVARGTADTLSTRVVLEPRLIAPVQQGQVIGKVEILQGDTVLNQADIVAMETVEEGGFFRRVWDSIRLFFKGIFG
jgi:serine-type D-Ala-D-Ala carboxypeptidase (penicillin-binding protein 5/6)